MEYTNPIIETISVDQLQLDLENPRHEPVIAEEAVVEWLLDNDKQVKMFSLMKDLAENGWCVHSNLPLVIKTQAGDYVCADGNRRLCALKLFQNSGLAERKYRARIEKIALNVLPGTLPTELSCVLEPDRKACMETLYRIHANPSANVIGWQRARKTEFARKHGIHNKHVLVDLLLSKITQLFGTSVGSVENLSRPRFLTILKSPAFQKHAGIKTVIQEKDSDILFLIKEAESLKPIVQVVKGLNEQNISAEDVSNEEKIQTHIAAQKPEHSPQDRSLLDKPLSLVKTTGKQKSIPSGKQKKNGRPARTTRDCKYLIPRQFFIDTSNAKLLQIIKELKSLALTEYPCAISSLIRQLIEIAMADAEGKYFGIAKRAPSLTQASKNICAKLNAEGWLDGRLTEGILKGLDDPESLFNMSTLHGYLHNPTLIPTPHELKTWWKRYEPFIQGCYELVAARAQPTLAIP